MASKGYDKDVYFASIEDPIELASAMKDKISTWRGWIASKGLVDLWQRKLKNYYGMSDNGNSSQNVNQGGSQGELSLIKVNDFRNLLQQQLVLVTAQRPAGIAKAINSDSQSIKASQIGTAITEYYLGQNGFETQFVASTEGALVCDEYFIDCLWDKDAGEPIAVDPDTGLVEMAGDAKIRIHAPWNVARDPGAPIASQRWYIISFRENKFDLAAKYPKFAEQIINCKDDGLQEIPMNVLPDDTDQVWCHLLVHDRTPAVRDGRYSMMIGDFVVLDMKELPYKDFVVDRIAPSDVLDGCLGYSSSNDILGLEEITDALHSLITTNETNFGGQTIVGPKGGDLNYSELAKGMRYIELPPEHVDKLFALQLTKTAPEIFNYIQVLTQKKQEQVGSVNNSLAAQAMQGASGSSMALIQAQAIQFNSGLQRSYAKLLSSVMTKVINILAKYADTPRVARIVGRVKAANLKEFKYTGESLNSISTVVFEVTNALSQTLGGRLEMANNLLNAGQFSGAGAAKQYITTATTGNLDALVQNDEQKELALLEENEWLMDGKKPTAVITENHADHINSHSSVISSPREKDDGSIVSVTLEHIQEHVDMWISASQNNPGILLATGQQPLMAPPPPQPTAPPNMPNLAGNGQQPSQNIAQDVNQPNLPTNPMTGEQAVIPGVNT